MMYKVTHTQWSFFKPKVLPIALELVPWLIQVATIVAFVMAAHPDLMNSLGAIILSFLWLHVSNNSKLADQYVELRERRELFTQLGEWMGREDAGHAVDRIQADCLAGDGEGDGSDASIENVRAAVTAAGIGAFARGIVGVALYAYLATLLLRSFM